MVATGMKRAAVYVRVSSAGQEDGYSLVTQEARCRAHAAEQGLTVVAVFTDVHTGAEWRERPGLSRLRESVRRREVDVVIAFALDRLSRKQAHVAILADEMEQAGVRLDFVSEQFEETSVGQFIRSAKAFAAEIEREKLTERTSRGRLARVQSGKLMPGARAPFGYRWRDESKGQLDEDPTTGRIVRRIFDEIANGLSLGRVASGLMRDAIPTPTGKDIWHASTLSHILHSPRYRGEAYGWGIRKAGVRPQTFDPAKAIRLPDGTIPALVDDATWAAVQAVLARNKAQSIRSARNPETALLRGGFVRCGTCGRVLSARPRSTGGVDYCCARSHGLPCPRPTTIKGSVLDPVVWARARAIVTDPDTVARELERLRGDDPTAEDIRAVSRSLADVEKQQANLGRMVAMLDNPDDAAPLVAQLHNLGTRHRALRAEGEALEKRRLAWAANQVDLDNFAAWCQAAAPWADSMDWEQKRLALTALNVVVTVYPHDHDPRYVITADIDAVSLSNTS